MPVYFVSADYAFAPIKIGYTSGADAGSRIANLQTGCPWPLNRLLLIPGQRGSRQLESELHKIFQRYRLEGEWFQKCAPILDFVKDVKTDGLRRAIEVATQHQMQSVSAAEPELAGPTPSTADGDAAEQRAFTVDEFCERWRIGRNTFYNLVARSELKTIKVGRRRLVTREQEELFRIRMEVNSR